MFNIVNVFLTFPLLIGMLYPNYNQIPESHDEYYNTIEETKSMDLVYQAIFLWLECLMKLRYMKKNLNYLNRYL